MYEVPGFDALLKARQLLCARLARKKSASLFAIYFDIKPTIRIICKDV